MVTKEKAVVLPTRRSVGFTDQLVEPLNRLRNEMDRLFEGFPARLPAFQFGKLDSALTFPAVEMKETKKSYKLSIEVPGVDPKEVEVTVDNGALVIKGEKKAEHEEEEKGYFYSERSYGSFERRIELPPAADLDNIKAVSKDGVLQVTIHKSANAEEGKRRIAIEA